MTKFHEMFFLGEISFSNFEKTEKKNIETFGVSAEDLLNELLVIPILEIYRFVLKNANPDIDSANILQFSSFNHGTSEIITRLRMAGDYGPTFCDLGEQILGQGKKKGAYIKYGENHAKLAQLFDLVFISTCGVSRVYLTDLGRMLEKRNDADKVALLTKLALRIPIIQHCYITQNTCSADITNVLKKYLSNSTAIRRRCNVSFIIKMIDNAILCEE